MSAGWTRCGVLGAAIWLGLAAARARPLAAFDAIDSLLALHLLCLTPLLLALRPPALWARWIWAAGAATAAGSVLLVGPARAALPVLWLVFAAGLLAREVREALAQRTERTGLRAVGHLFLLVGAGWIVVSRSGIALPGLDPEKVLLAAIHSHYTGFGGLLLMAEATRRASRGERRALVVTGAGLAVGFGITGVGIAFAHGLEPVGAAVLALAFCGYGAVRLGHLLLGVRATARVLGLISVVGLAVGVALGVLYSARAFGEVPVIRADMIRLHGVVLGLGFVLCGAASHLMSRARAVVLGDAPVVVYDGACGLCDHSVQWILAHDRLGRIRFAALQGETAAPILDAHGLRPAEGEDFDTIIFVGPGDAVRVRSRAAAAILVHMGGLWRPLGHLFLLVPRAIADAGYRVVAANRHRLFPPPDACRVPKPGERARFLP